MHRPHTIALVALTALITLSCVASPAHAQSQGDDGEATNTSRALITTLVLPGTTSTTSGWLWVEGWITDRREVDPELQELRQLVRLQRYVTRNEAAVRMALTLGAGPALDDLRMLVGHTSRAPHTHARQHARQRGLRRLRDRPLTLQTIRALHAVLCATPGAP